MMHDQMSPTAFLLLIGAGFLVLILLRGFGMNQEYQRGVIFRLGRVIGIKGPGWFWRVPLVDRVAKVDIRTVTKDLETQETVTRDGVAVKVNAVIWFRVGDPVRVIVAVQDWQAAVTRAAETGLRDAIGQHELDQLLKDRMKVNAQLAEMLTRAVEQWGVMIDAVEMKDLDIPEQMQRALAREAEAVREKRARVIKAEGEREAAATLAEAARLVGGTPGALELRRLQTLSEIGAEHNSTIIAMIPTELLHALHQFGAAPTQP